MKDEKYLCLECGEILRIYEIRARSKNESPSYECPICFSKDKIRRLEDIVKSERVQNALRGSLNA